MKVSPFLLIIYIILFAILLFVVFINRAKNESPDFMLNMIQRIQDKIDSLDNEITDLNEQQSYDAFCRLNKLMGKLVRKGYVVFIEFELENKGKYLLTGYKSHVSFKRNLQEESEISYSSMAELFQANLIDNINFKRDWAQVKNLKINWKQNKEN